ncbi:MAG: hypothetical protein ABI639_05480 [Thermoanaerobaculia bacterium]
MKISLHSRAAVVKLRDRRIEVVRPPSDKGEPAPRIAADFGIDGRLTEH